jgi:hypothetical protein
LICNTALFKAYSSPFKSLFFMLRFLLTALCASLLLLLFAQCRKENPVPSEAEPKPEEATLPPIT